MGETAPNRGPVRLGAALFNGDHARLADELGRLEAAGLDFVHLDVFDGRFVPDLGFPPRTVAALRPLSDLPFEVHLGAEEPLRFVPALAEAGADLILLHAESVSLLYETVFAAREHGARIGLAVALGTSLSAMEAAVPMIDAILLLSRVTGEGARGAEFNPLILPRVRAVSEMVEEAGVDLEIQVAGGVRREHAPDLVAAGADALTLGGGLYKAPDMGREVAELRRAVGAGVG